MSEEWDVLEQIDKYISQLIVNQIDGLVKAKVKINTLIVFKAFLKYYQWLEMMMYEI